MSVLENVQDPASPTSVVSRPSWRRRLSIVVGAIVLFLALVLPGAAVTPLALLRIPIEGVLAVALLLVLPARLRAGTAGVLGALLGVIALLAGLNAGFRAVLDRSFDPVTDATLLREAGTFVSGRIGEVGGTIVTVLAVALAVAVPIGTAVAAVAVGRVVVGHRTRAARGVLVTGALWLICAAVGAQLVPGVPVAAAGVSATARDTAVAVPASLRAQREFDALLRADPLAGASAEQLLAGLRGKDVVVAFVESYGRDAVENPEFAGVGEVLDAGTATLGAAGFGARSGFLTSPVVGGNSWLAHATLLTGLPVGDQNRYRALVESQRRSLAGIFADAGWHTVAVQPGTVRDWPDAAFHGFREVIDFARLGYRGPDLGWASVPDQYTFDAFDRLTGARTDGGPVMAEIDLVSSHAPWPFIPPLLDWGGIGDGSVYGPLAADAGDRDAVWARGATVVRDTYRRSLEYSLESLISWTERRSTRADADDLVVVLLGDHQPMTLITGEGAGRDVPITILSRDQTVLDRVGPWGWTPGLRPAPDAPVWPMSDFRDRFVETFGG